MIVKAQKWHLVGFAALSITTAVWADTQTVGGYTWTYRIINGTAEIFNNYSVAISPNPTGSITIPNKLGGKPVTCIGKYAFFRCSEISSVTIPEGIRTIDDGAFDCCSKLSRVVLPDGVESIGSVAFAYCYGLKEMILPNSVTNVNVQAFTASSNLTSVVVSQYLVDDTLISTKSHFISVFPDAYRTIRNVSFAEGVTYVGDYAFNACTGLVNATIPSSVTRIGKQAFSQCGLRELAIPNSVTNVAVNAYHGCRDLTSVTIPKCCTGASAIKFMFPDSQIKDVCVNEGVTQVDQTFLYGCEGIESLRLPGSLTTTGAFKSLDSLKYVVIPQGVCSSKMSTIFPLSYQVITNIVVCEGVTSIGNSAFSDCSNLVSLKIPSSVKNIGSSVLNGCFSFGELNIDNLTDWCGVIISGMLILPGQYFESGQYLGYNLYVAGDKVTDLIIPENVTRIGNYAFCGCSTIKSLTIPGNVNQIGVNSFMGCIGLTRVVAKEGVASTGTGCFLSCENIKDLILPSSLKKIGDGSFSGCTSLQNVVVNNTICRLKNGLKNGSCAFGDHGAYQSITNVTLLSDVDMIQSELVSGCLSLASIDIPFSVTNISDSAFSSCTNLRFINVDLENPSYKTIEGILVSKNGMTMLTVPGAMSSIRIPESVTRIKAQAFSGCEHISSVDIPDCFTNVFFEGNAPQISSSAFSDHTATRVAYVKKSSTGWDEDGDGNWHCFKLRYLDDGPIPELSPMAVPQDVVNALGGAIDAKLKANVTNVAQYAAYRTWALSVTNDTVTAQMVKGSSQAWLSYALGADILIVKEISSEDVKIDSFTPFPSEGMFEFAVSVKDINIGSGTIADFVLKENLQKVLGVEGAITLVDDAFSSDNVTVVFGTPQNGKARLMVAPRNEKAQSFFMKVKLEK